MSLRRSLGDLEAQRTIQQPRSEAQDHNTQSAAVHSHKTRILKDGLPYPIDVREQVYYEESPPRSGKHESVSAHPEHPPQWPPERILFLLGILFFPFWILGAFWRWRDGFEPCECLRTGRFAHRFAAANAPRYSRGSAQMALSSHADDALCHHGRRSRRGSGFPRQLGASQV
ncbi:hypothetical protein BV20DRAFT_18480 [Pilatotrama ljubarskyi]|nr:hypothetical protein BV20DRAFT_18480 [Pilatotrama ljubarskyi]